MSRQRRHASAVASPSRIAGNLSLREARFVRLYVGEARGNGRYAARLAGYHGSVAVLDVQAARLLRRERVREAIRQALEADASRSGLSKDCLVRKTLEVMAENRPFERLKAAELLAKLMGWYTPARQVADPIPLQGGSASYAALVETIRSWGRNFTYQEREIIRKELLQVISEATKAVELLGSDPA